MTQLQKLDAMAKPRSEEAIKKAEKQREYNDLLFQDLCARLPYGVKFNWCDNFFHADYYTLISINEEQIIGRNVNQEDCLFFIEEVKPYLRPLSSMTDDERQEYGLVLCGELSINQFDWLNHKMFDYRGLIPKGLAIEAPEDNNPYK